MTTNQSKLNTLVGLAMIGSSITGAISLVAALFPFSEGNFQAMAVCLIAAALAFGLLANAMLRQ